VLLEIELANITIQPAIRTAGTYVGLLPTVNRVAFLKIFPPVQLDLAALAVCFGYSVEGNGFVSGSSRCGHLGMLRFATL
jgi:hypothetical protein